MPTAVKSGLVVALVAVVGYTLYIISQPGQPKASLELDARSSDNTSDLASDLSASIRDSSTARPSPTASDDGKTRTGARRGKPAAQTPRSGVRESSGTRSGDSHGDRPAAGAPDPGAGDSTRPKTITPTERPARRPSSVSRELPSPIGDQAQPTTQPKEPRQPSGAAEDADQRPEQKEADPPKITGQEPAAGEPGASAGDTPLRPQRGAARSSQPPVKPEAERPARRSDTVPGAAGAPSVGQRMHTIEVGDTLVDLADRYYEDESLWRVISVANPSIDANRLQIGQKLVIPPKPADRPPAEQPATGITSRQAPGGELIYVVERGDTLSKIAREVLKDETRWREIYELNREEIGAPDHILVGMKLKLPPLKKTDSPPS